MAGLLLEQPSKINNLGYFILGLYIASLIRYNISLTLEQQIAFIVTFGGFIGTLVYYIKPVEKLVLLTISLFNSIDKFRRRGYIYDFIKNESGVDNAEYLRQIRRLWSLAPKISKRHVFYSNFLADDRTLINGIFFLSFGLFTSHPMLNSVELGNYYQIVRVIAALLLFVGLWNIYELIQFKMPPLIFLYLNYNITANKNELFEALGVKDWLRSKKIMEKEPILLRHAYGVRLLYSELTELTSRFSDVESIPEHNKGICFKCNEIVDAKQYCPLCGNIVIVKCINCSKQLIEEDVVKKPTFCNYCGENIETMFLWLLDHNVYKSNLAQSDISHLVSSYHKSKEILNRYKDYIFNTKYQIGPSITLHSYVHSDRYGMSEDDFLWNYFNLVLKIPISNKEMIVDIISELESSHYCQRIKKIICNIDDTYSRTSHILYEEKGENGFDFYTIIVESADAEIKKKIEIINNILERKEVGLIEPRITELFEKDE